MISLHHRRSLVPLNKISGWQLLLVLLPLLLGLIYALPNWYGETPALQISSRSGEGLTTTFIEQVQHQLKLQQLSPKQLQLQGKTLQLSWSDLESQRRAHELLSHQLGERYIAALTLLPATPVWLSRLGAQPMKLGLDLRGGVRLLLAVDTDSILQQQQKQLTDRLRTTLRSQQLQYRRAIPDREGTLLSFSETQRCQEAKKILTTQYPELLFKEQTDNTLYATFSASQRQAFTQQATQRNLTILRKRINELGVVEAVVQQQGSQRIVVELPGIQDSTRAKQILGATALLEFRLVNQQMTPQTTPLPADTERHYRADGHSVALFKTVVLSGERITQATAQLDTYGRPQVHIELDSLGGEQLYAVTKQSIGKQMATLLTEYRPQLSTEATQQPLLKKHQSVINVAQIEDRLGRQFRISGVGTLTEARNLALLLRSGTLSAPLQIIEERVIGPSLGKQNIHQGLQACGWGLAVSLLFLVCYYRYCGVIASVALLGNLLLLLASLSLLPGVTLTLPGIAGIVLTVGMAVDANVLIFERIKEEMRLGRTVQQSIDQGFHNAFSSICDANVTTLITALLLYAIGTGPIKGFAITLSIGLATSTFTAIVVTRAMINRLYGGKPLSTLSI
jgi:preprotein translocase subunit SecD